MKKIVSIILASAMVLSMAACGSSSSSSTASTTASQTASGSQTSNVNTSKDTLNVEIASDPGDLSPYGSWNGAGMKIKFVVMQPLFRADSNNTMQPCVVDTYEWVDDTHIKLKLKEGIKFSNGHDLTTEDVMYSLAYAHDDSVFQIQGGNVDIENCEVIDDYNMVLALVNPSAYFFTSVGSINIADSEVPMDEQKENPIGSGPYVVDNIVLGDSITLKYNENYWNKENEGEPAIKTIVLHIVSEPAQRIIAMETGTLDFLWDVPSSEIAGLDSADWAQLFQTESTYTYGLWTNCTNNSIFEDQSLRKAVALAVDPAAVTQVAFGQSGTLAHNVFSDVFTGVTGGALRYNSGTTYYCQANQEEAKKLVDAYKAEHPNADMHIKLLSNGESLINDAESVILNELTNIGFDVEIISYEAAVYQTVIQSPYNGEWDIIFNRQGAPSGNIADFLNSCFGNTGTNRSGLQNQELFDIINEMIVTVDNEARMTELCDRAVEILTEENPFIPITQETTTWAYVTGLEGVIQQGIGYVDYTTFYFAN